MGYWNGVVEQPPSKLEYALFTRCCKINKQEYLQSYIMVTYVHTLHFPNIRSFLAVEHEYFREARTMPGTGADDVELYTAHL
jgi:hypothetical protein